MKRRKWQILCIALSGCLMHMSCAKAETGSKGFDTPEEAVITYLNGLRNMDLEQMAEVFAVEEYVENYDFQRQLERIGSYSYSWTIKYPNTNDLTKELNLNARKSEITNSIENQYFYLCYPDFDVSMAHTVEEGTESAFVEDLESEFNSTDLGSLEILGFISPEVLSALYANETNKIYIDDLRTIYGADQMESCTAIFELESEPYLLCADVACYQDKWYLLDLGGNIGNLLGISMYAGGIVPLSPEDLNINLDIDWMEELEPVN